MLYKAKTVSTRSAITPPKNEPIWMKSRTVWAKNCGLAFRAWRPAETPASWPPRVAASTKLWKFYHKGSFFQRIRKNCSQNFQVLRLQAIITPQWLQIAGNSRPNSPSTEYLFLFLLLESLQSLSPGLYAAHQKGTYPNFRQSSTLPWTSCWVITQK